MSAAKTDVSRRRWLVAQAEERRDVGNAALVKKNLVLRRHTWSRLLQFLRPYVTIGKTTRVLDIGGGPTPVFLGAGECQKWAVDPNHDFMHDVHPFMKDVPEYKDVTFVSSAVEDWSTDARFDVVFGINWLDHVADLKKVVAKIDELLRPSGTLVLIVDCYADAAARKVVTLFDVDVPHPHHFVPEDILTLFSRYTLEKRDDEVHTIFSENPFPEEESDRTSGIRLLARRYLQHVREHNGGPMYAFKYFVCYGLVMTIASLRRKERPVYPLKKLRLFIFRKV